MKRYVLLLILWLLSPLTIGNVEKTHNENEYTHVKVVESKKELLYICWGSIYNAVESQCDDSPLITSSGFKINPKKASEQRIIAVSQNMLNSKYHLLLNKKRKNNKIFNKKRFVGKIAFGDSVWVESPKDKEGNYIYPQINGWWRVEDVKNKRYTNSIDFLQTIGDKRLYNNNPLWNGIFKHVKIYFIIKQTQYICKVPAPVQLKNIYNVPRKYNKYICDIQ